MTAHSPHKIHNRLKTLMPLVALIAPACLVFAAPAAYADGAIPTFSQDSQHIVRFTYSPDDVYHIKTEPHMITDLRLAPGEKMEMLALGNTAQWIRASAPGNVFLKPTRPGLTTSGTLVTNFHTYQLLITSSKTGGDWYQQVSWNYGHIIAMASHNPIAAMSDVPATPVKTETQKQVAETEAHSNAGQSHNLKAISNLHFDYKISGHAQFRPSEVFDNGTFTWIKIPSVGNAAMPVVFVRSHGEYVITNYTVKGRYLIVQQLFHKAKLRIGHRVVTITRG